MPFVELHGMSGVDALHCKSKIFESVKQHAPELLEKVFVDIYPDSCVNHKGDKQPFIRIYTGKFEKEVLSILQKAGVNAHIEVIQVKTYLARKK